MTALLSYLAKYFKELIAIFSGPNAFIESKNISTDSTFKDAFRFLVLSIIIASLVEFPLLLGPGPSDLNEYLAIEAVESLLAVVLSILFLKLSWLIVGGKATLQNIFVPWAYFIGVFIVVTTIIWFFIGSYLKVTKSDIDIRNTLFLVITISAPAWLLFVWDTLRKLNSVSKLRSSIAFIVFLFLGTLIVGSMYCILVPAIIMVQRSVQ